MIKYILFLSTMLVATSAYAEPNQIEIIGIIPGVSTEVQVEAAKTQREIVNSHIIGGFSLVCISKYIDGRLSQFLCPTGEDYYSTDETKESYTVVSNIEVHGVLLKGFTKKFGLPTDVTNQTIQNRFGTKFNQSAVTWIDKKGNSLMLLNIANKTTEGLLMMESAQKIKLDKEKKKAANQQRSF